MKPLVFVMSLLAAWTSFAADSPLRVLVVTGGHGFESKPFFRMFEENAAITFTNAVQAKTSSSAYDRDDLLTYDCVVLYDMVQPITEAQKAKLLAALDKGIGLVVLHHALVSYQGWPEFEQIVGGTYPEAQDKKGGVSAALGYEHDVDVPVIIAAKDHPITAGLADFPINDEIYWGFRVLPSVTTLITTSHPKSGKPLGWCHGYRNSRVVYLQLGHGPTAYNNTNYKKLLAQSIKWAGKRS
jgi:type 1 glutamine amidotransferase